MVKHIALEIKESDIDPFYTEILGGKIEKQFTLNEEEARRIFNVPGQINVFEMDLNNLKFELFIHDALEKDSLQHTCIELANSSEVFAKAGKKSYWTYLKKRDDAETYFIKDHNGNLFEIR